MQVERRLYDNLFGRINLCYSRVQFSLLVEMNVKWIDQCEEFSHREIGINYLVNVCQQSTYERLTITFSALHTFLMCHACPHKMGSFSIVTCHVGCLVVAEGVLCVLTLEENEWEISHMFRCMWVGGMLFRIGFELEPHLLRGWVYPRPHPNPCTSTGIRDGPPNRVSGWLGFNPNCI